MPTTRATSRRGPAAWAMAAVLAGAAFVATVAPAIPAVAAPTSVTFLPNPSQHSQSWVVPAGVTSATFDLFGDHGKDWCAHTGGLGGETIATIPVTPGETLQINVASTFYGAPAYNSSDVRRGAFTLSDRLIVAAGGGGAADEAGQNPDGSCATSGLGFGGTGGDPDGSAGTGVTGMGSPGGVGGGGATQSGGGAGGGSVAGVGGGAGSFGVGGAAGAGACGFGGTGGYGWFGGGGGGSAMDPIDGVCETSRGGGGGGGSSFVEPAGTGVVFNPGLASPLAAGAGGSVTITTGNGPTVSSVAPAAGPTGGGTPVTIEGTGFTGATKVKFGSTAAKHVVVVSDTEITATSPARLSGSVDVHVTTPVGTSPTSAADVYTYDAVPSVSRIGPSKGPHAGGTVVAVSGTGFVAGSTVHFGATAAVTVVLVSRSKLRATSPPGSGTVDITVSTPGGTSPASTADRFTYRH